MSKVFKRGPKTPEMNMTPLIDVTFQLILFFMVVSNIVSEQAVQMLVPDLEDPKTRELGEVDKITINIAPVAPPSSREDNPLAASGNVAYVMVGSQRFVPTDGEGITAALAAAAERAPKDENDKTTLEVLLRADSAIYFEEVKPVMEAIAAAKIGTINLVAMLPEDMR